MAKRVIWLPVRWCLQHPWATFWGALVALDAVILLFGVVVTKFRFPRLVNTLANVLMGILIISFFRGIYRSWRRSKVGALVKVFLPIVLIAGITFISERILVPFVQRSKYAGDTQQLAALQRAIEAYRQRYGQFPVDKGAASSLLMPHLIWNCHNQDWTYNPTFGTATLRVVDKGQC